MTTSRTVQAPSFALTRDGRDRLERRLVATRLEIDDLDAMIKAGEATADQRSRRMVLDEQRVELERLLDHAVDIADIDEDPSIVEVGDEVDVEDDDGATTTFSIVNAAEISPVENRISPMSPLGRALLGARIGDRVQVQAPGGPYECTIRGRRRLT